jgi:cytochrome c
MKKTFTILSLSLIIAACGGNKSDKTSADTTVATNQNAAAANSDAAGDTVASNTGAEKSATAGTSAKGAQLIAKSDCLTCHKEHEKLIGPAYADVAKKYAGASDAQVDTLVHKVIMGGKGNWGDIPMTPHPALDKADVKEMVKYVLSLK